MSAKRRGPEQPIKAEPYIVICDDESRLATLTAGLLRELGYSTCPVTLGSEAIDAVAQSAVPCVLVLDVHLRVGTSAASVLEAVERHRVAVVLTSGLGEEELPDGVRRHPLVATYLSKPYSVDELANAVNVAQRRIPELPLRA